MPQRSAGILMFRRTGSEPEVLLIHPGGPFWAKKDLGAWSIPKGLYEPDEDVLAAARREFLEETGCAPSGEPIPLGEFRPGSKLLTVYAVQGDFDLELCQQSGSMEWPPKSEGWRFRVDRGGWFSSGSEAKNPEWPAADHRDAGAAPGLAQRPARARAVVQP
jgi:predicted NUDIX family NTP pyrophosphohydrolase